MIDFTRRPGSVNPQQPVTQVMYPQDNGPNALEVQLANAYGRYQAPGVAAFASTERRFNDNLMQIMQSNLYKQQQEAAAQQAMQEQEAAAQGQQNDILKELIKADPSLAGGVASEMGLPPAFIQMLMSRQQAGAQKDIGAGMQSMGSAYEQGLDFPQEWWNQNFGTSPEYRTPTSTQNALIRGQEGGPEGKYNKRVYWTQDGQQITENVPAGQSLPPPAAQSVNPEGSSDSAQFRQRNLGQAYSSLSPEDQAVVNPGTGQDMTYNGQRGIGFQRSDGKTVFVPVLE